MLGSRSPAEDACQEVFIKAYRSLERFKNAASFSTWIYRIASNHCLDLLRREAREKTDSLEALLESEGGQIRAIIPSDPDSSLAAENRDLVHRVLNQLPPDYRLMLVLRETQGLSYEELAETLDCSLDSVKSKLKRARQALEEILRHFLKPGGV